MQDTNTDFLLSDPSVWTAGKFPVAAVPVRRAEDVPADHEALARAERLLDETERALAEANRTTTELSIVMPVYNEQATLGAAIDRVLALDGSYELIIVDDGSTDGSAELLKQYAEHDRVTLLQHEKNRGKGAALQTGFARAGGEIVIVQDADLEYDPEEIAILTKPILAGACDVVYGSRYLYDEGNDPSRIHRLGNQMLTWFSNLTTRQRLTDMETCYKAIRRKVLLQLPLAQKGFGFEPEVTAKLARRGHHIYEMPISYRGRGYAAGKKIGPRDALATLWCIARYAVKD